MVLEKICQRIEDLKGRMIRLEGDISGFKRIGRPKKTGFAYLSGLGYNIADKIYELATTEANAYSILSVNSEAVIVYCRLNRKQIRLICEGISAGRFPLTIESNPLSLTERAERMSLLEVNAQREQDDAEFHEQLKRERIERERLRWLDRARSI